MRWVGRLFALVGLVLFVAVAVVGFEAYLSFTGRDLSLLNAIVARFGHLVASQRTESLALDVTVDPDEGTLEGRARLRVKQTVDGQRRLYFLLGDAFRLTHFSAAGFPEARAYKLWLITVIDLGRAPSAGQVVDVGLDYEGRPATGLFGLGSARVSPRDVQLSVDSFWFPNDLQGQFEADVAVTLPAHLTVVHAGEEIESSRRGRMQRLRWRYKRPVPSLSLVAGMYRVSDLRTEGGSYRLYLAEDVELDAQRILRLAADADGLLTQRYGASGYSQQSLFVTRRLRRAYNDGAGVMGLSIRYFRRGDYGSNVIAHEIAHNWWGATVMERWLAPRTGGEWLVEGFAEFSSMLVAEATHGREALARRLAANFFDPRRDAAVGAMSVLDNAVGDDAAREIIYNKGGYVAMMLRRLIGDDAFFPALRSFLERYRFQAASDVDLETAIGQSSGVDVSSFFAEWVRSDHGLDLALERGEGEALSLRNLGNNTAVGEVEIDGLAAAAPVPAAPQAAPEPPADAPEASSSEAAPRVPAPEAPTPARAAAVPVGATVPLPSSDAVLNTDPDLDWADMVRDNNRFPQRRFPLALAVRSGGSAQVASEVFPWSPATLTTRDAGGAVLGTWELPATVVSWPRWLDEHTLVLNTTDAAQRSPAVVLFDTRDGGQRLIGRGIGPAVAPGSVYASQGESLVRWQAPEWRREVLVRQKRRAFGPVTPAPDGTRIAYAVSRDNDLEIRVMSLADRRERTLLHWDRDLRDLVWSADGAHLFAAIGGEWDWQVWQIAVDTGAVQVLAREAAVLGTLAVSPEGNRLAFSAAPEIDYPFNRREIIVLDLDSRAAKRIPVSGRDVRQVVWQDGDTLLAITAPSAASTPFRLPEERSVVRVTVSDGRIATEN